MTILRILDMKRRNRTDRSQPDHYAMKAKKENFPARSIYKLEELQKKFRLIRTGDKVLDLGCAPGSWLKYAAGITGPGGQVAGIDLKPVTVELPDHVRAITGDIMEMDDRVRAFIGDGYDVVLSDMAPSTTGHKDVDAVRSLVLCEAALGIADRVLSPGGRFAVKIFQGQDFEKFIKSVRERFEARKIFKPQTCRKESKEIYVIGIGKK